MTQAAAESGKKLDERNGSKIFVGHRALGRISNHIPIVTRYITRRKEHLVSFKNNY